MNVRTRLILVGLLAAGPGFAADAWAHCDTVNGPVVVAARDALEAGDVTPALKWVKESDEAEVRQAFRMTMAARGASAAAMEVADRFFFETVVRLHRAGEGEPYTGLKDGTRVDTAIEEADKALERGDAAALVKATTAHVAEGIRERFARVQALRPHAGESVAAGRRYVAAYVDFIHFVETVQARHEGEGK